MKYSIFLSTFLLVGVLAYSAHGLDGDEVAAVEKVGAKPKSQGTVEDRHRLVAKLFHGYNKAVNPDKANVTFGISLINFNVCDKRQVLDTYAWLKMVWYDSRLSWDEEEFGKVEILRFDSKEVWKPDVTLYNSADLVNMMNCWDSNVLIYPDGMLMWVPPCKLQSLCKLNLKVHPYGEQTCSMKFGSWTYDSNNFDLNLYKNEASIDLKDLSSTADFEIVKTSAEREVKYYSCCEEPYASITFNMTMKRIPGEELMNKL